MSKLKKVIDPLQKYLDSLKVKSGTDYLIKSDTTTAPITNLSQNDYSSPLMVLSDLRIFGGRLNSDGGTTTLYTVPEGYFYYINQLFKLTDIWGGGANPLYLSIYDVSGNLIWRMVQNGTSYDGLNKLPETIKLVAGDYITIRDDYFSYHGYSLSVAIIGTKELDTTQVRNM